MTTLSASLALAAFAWWLCVPAYRVGSDAARKTLLEVNGVWALVLLAFPVVVASLPLVWRKRPVRIVSALVLVLFAFISGFSVGSFYLPAGIAMAFAGMRATAPVDNRYRILR